MPTKHSALLQALVDNKKEYMSHLGDLLSEPLLVTIQELYTKAAASKEARRDGVLRTFQDALAKIPEWNTALVQDTGTVIVSRSGCSYMNDLIQALIVTYVKYTLVSNNKQDEVSKIKLRIPSVENFIHRCLVVAARSFWKQPHMFYDKVRSIERQENMLAAERLIRKGIENAVRFYVPMETIIQSIQLTAPHSDEEVESHDDEEEYEESEVETITNSTNSDEESELVHTENPHLETQEEDSEEEPHVEEEFEEEICVDKPQDKLEENPEAAVEETEIDESPENKREETPEEAVEETEIDESPENKREEASEAAVEETEIDESPENKREETPEETPEEAPEETPEQSQIEEAPEQHEEKKSIEIDTRIHVRDDKIVSVRKTDRVHGAFF